MFLLWDQEFIFAKCLNFKLKTADGKLVLRSVFFYFSDSSHTQKGDCALRDDEHLGDRPLRFVGGRSTGDYLSLNHPCQCKYYTHVSSHSDSITSALKLFLYLFQLISPTHLLISVK
jgi:hypothetical protein